jgi:hypothetical protein
MALVRRGAGSIHDDRLYRDAVSLIAENEPLGEGKPSPAQRRDRL